MRLVYSDLAKKKKKKQAINQDKMQCFYPEFCQIH